MPLVKLLFGYQIYFWSNENSEPVHFHISKGKRGNNSTKFWVLSDGSVMLCHNKSRYSKKDISKIISYCNKNTHFVEDIVHDWYRYKKYIKFYK